ncbi:hypothetical protein GDO78_017789 [Eleutherodactylus coqui]|uniref:Uncharacterized protein n=1 Tax=Eleutherodactylus coqui TaxID=57060 RepID=A0A8J6EK11_ELECQ|nr:hypothetical protein GDO78_017789 [Eleutherodactylus coqui]
MSRGCRVPGASTPLPIIRTPTPGAALLHYVLHLLHPPQALMLMGGVALQKLRYLLHSCLMQQLDINRVLCGLPAIKEYPGIEGVN